MALDLGQLLLSCALLLSLFMHGLRLCLVNVRLGSLQRMRYLIYPCCQCSSVLPFAQGFTLKLSDTSVELIELSQQSVIVLFQRFVELQETFVLPIGLLLLLSPVLLTLRELLYSFIAFTSQSIYLAMQLFDVNVELLDQLILLGWLRYFLNSWFNDWLTTTNPMAYRLLHWLYLYRRLLSEHNLRFL